MMIPIIFFLSAFSSKKAIPTRMVKKGVNAFKIPASELSILVSARQNKKAGIKLPRIPDNATKPNLFLGTCLIALKAKGIKTTPALKMRKAAT